MTSRELSPRAGCYQNDTGIVKGAQLMPNHPDGDRERSG
jgi:hypothetical protein